MLTIRNGDDRGLADFGWLKSRHTFSFGDYFDPQHMGLGPLRVINEDRVAPGAGFGKHPHSDMEILSWVLDGALEHKDSMGNGTQIRPGELQRMTAGTGVTHSEFNASDSAPVHFLQIWVLPERRGLTPGYAQYEFTDEDLTDRWCLVASGRPREQALKIHQDADLYIARLHADGRLGHRTDASRKLWVQVARGEIEIDGHAMRAGDGAALSDVSNVEVRATNDAEVLLFDMAA